MEGKLNFLFAILAVILIASIALLTYSCSTPSVPPYFNRKLAFEDAAGAADQNGKPVFALFTVEGSDPCTSFKKHALRDQRIIKWVTDNAQPAYIDMTKADAGNTDAAALATRYGVDEFPTLLLIRKGREVSRLVGDVPVRDLLKWLEDSTKAEATPKG